MAAQEPQIPGDTPPASDSAPVAVPKSAKAAKEETVAVPKSQLEALMARVEALEAGQGASANARVAEDSLPEHDDVDPAKIKSPVLTKQGWVVPNSLGSHPNAPKG